MMALYDRIRGSLVWRTVAFANIASVTIVVAMLGLTLRFAEQSFEGLRDLTLWDQVDEIQAGLRIEDGAISVALRPAIARHYAAADGAMRYAILTADGTLRLGSPGLSRPLVDPATVRGIQYFVYEDPASGLVGRGVQARLRWHDDLVLQVGQGPHHADVFTDSVVAELAEHFALALVIGLLVQVAVTTLTIHSTLRPLARIAEATASPAAAAARRLPLAEAPIELRPVVATINALLDDLERNLDRQRRFTADAAHQLRTPLARLEARLDDPECAAMAQRLREPLDRIRDLVTGLLDVARAEAITRVPDTVVDLVEVAAQVGRDLAPAAIARGVAIELGAAVPSRTRGDAMWLAQALGNVVDNAIRHSRRGAAVTIDVPGDGSIVVTDRGPGVPEADRAMIFERFWRGRDEKEPGSGIGLSVVAAVLQAHGGSVRVDDAPGGGARFRLVLPRP